jgi:hypothetical protein
MDKQAHHPVGERHQEDAYWSPPIAVRELLKVEKFPQSIWEPACGIGNISRELIAAGYHVTSTDKYDWGYGTPGIDFLVHSRHTRAIQSKSLGLITNAPYKYQLEFLRQAEQVSEKFAFLMRLQYLEGKGRWEIYERHHLNVYIMGRLPFFVNGQVRRMIPYAWYVFDQSQHLKKRVRVFNLQGWRWSKNDVALWIAEQKLFLKKVGITYV